MYRVISASLTLAICITAPAIGAFGSDSSGQIAGMATSLAVCIGKFNAGRGYESYVPELTASSAAASASLRQLFPAMQVTDPSPYLKQIAEVESAFSQELIAEPLLIRSKLSSLKIECDKNTKQAIAFHQALERRDAQAEAAKLAEQQAIKKAEQARVAAEKAAKDHEDEQQRILAEAQKAQDEDAGPKPSQAPPSTDVANNPVDDTDTGPFQLNGKIPTIKNIALGAGPDSCPTKIEKSTYLNILKQPDRFAYTCEIEKGNDKTVVFFDSTGQRVVRINRRLGINTQEISFDDLLKNAVDNYGSPTMKVRNDLLGYGNMFEISPNGLYLDDKETGKGLRLQATLCSDRGDCSEFTDANIVFVLNLEDATAYNQSIADGKAAYKATAGAAAKSIDF